MPIDDLPSELIIPTKDQIAERYRRDARFRSGAVTDVGTKEYADSLLFADAASPLYFDAKNIGDYVANVNKQGEALDRELEAAGLYRLPAAGGSGFVKISASTGGGTIFAKDEIKHEPTGLRFECTATKLYQSGDFVPIVGKDTGPLTNLDPGAILKWTFNRPGISPSVTVVEQSDGSGLTGGRLDETDDEANNRLRTHRAKPPASGNDADYQKSIVETPGVTIQQGFTYDCLFGAGSVGFAFTLRPGTPGGSRAPNATQIALVKAKLKGDFPGNDGIYPMTVNEVGVDLVFDVSWAPGASEWEDANPWPKIGSGNAFVAVDGAVTPTTTTFRLTVAQVIDDPEAGQTIGFYDQSTGLFKKKRILSFVEVVSGKSWDIVCDTSNASSDLDFIPTVGLQACPWADSLQDLVSPTVNYFDFTGPGEVFDPLPDPGHRQQRSPRTPFSYESAVTNRILTPLFKLSSIHDIELRSPDVPYQTPIGTPGVTVNLFVLNSICAYPQE